MAMPGSSRGAGGGDYGDAPTFGTQEDRVPPAPRGGSSTRPGSSSGAGARPESSSDAGMRPASASANPPPTSTRSMSGSAAPVSQASASSAAPAPARQPSQVSQATQGSAASQVPMFQVGSSGIMVTGMKLGRSTGPALRLKSMDGQIGFRERRQPMVVCPQVPAAAPGDPPRVKKAEVVQKGWLQDQPGDGEYQRRVKQVMLVAAEQLKLFDAEDMTSSKFSAREIDDVKNKAQKLIAGEVNIPFSGSAKKTLAKVEASVDRKKDILIKFSSKCVGGYFQHRKRFFLIDSGELKIYYYENANKLSATIRLQDATCKIEDKQFDSVPKWEPGHEERIRVDDPDRQRQGKKPLYLYPNETRFQERQEKIQRWNRAFRMASLLVTENDRRSMKVAVGRATSQGLQKAWDALMKYSAEVNSTKQLVKSMGLRLRSVELSMGWTKLLSVYRKRQEDEKRRQGQQVWAARFMSERLGQLGKQSVKPMGEIRDALITRIQQRFRRYREDCIFDRTYPLSGGDMMMSQMAQAKVGQVVEVGMTSVKMDEAIYMLLGETAQKSWTDNDCKRQFGIGMKATYTEESSDLTPVRFSVSDNLTSLIFQATELGEDKVMGKAGWSKFANVDRMSSIVLHSEPLLGSKMYQAKADTSVWMTVNGPKLGWDRHTGKAPADDEYGNMTSRSVAAVKPRGAGDALQVPRQLVEEPSKVTWVEIELKVSAATLKSETERGLETLPDFREEAGDDPRVLPKTICRAHVLGYTFESPIKEGVSPIYNMSCKVSVPVASADKFVALDDSVVAIEILQLLGETAQDNPPVLRLVAVDKLVKICGAEESPETGEWNLPEKLKGAVSKTVRLCPPNLSLEQKEKDAKQLPFPKQPSSVNISITAKVAVAAQNKVACISPEILGCGAQTAVFTSHRAAWYDPELGPGKFRPDHVPNFAELDFGMLRFPGKDKVDSEKPIRYRIKATMNGFSGETSMLHRPTKDWAEVVGPMYGDTTSVRFHGCKVYLPLTPGAWDPSEEFVEKRKIKIEVIKVETDSGEAMSYEDVKSGGKSKYVINQTVVYKTVLRFSNLMQVDLVRSVSTPIVPSNSKEVPEMNVYNAVLENDDLQILREGRGDEKEESAAGLINLDFCLRDREYVKVNTGRPSERQSFCIGDKVSLALEEPFCYPSEKNEFRRRYPNMRFLEAAASMTEWPQEPKSGAPAPKTAKVDPKHQGRGCPLREPCLSSEWVDSDLGTLPKKEPFKQGFIPTFCTDVIPHRFVLPVTEKEFLDKSLPGFYPDIIADLKKAGSPDKKGKPATGVQAAMLQSGNLKPVVTHMKKFCQKVPVTLLAIYPPSTRDGDSAKCDVEMPLEFMNSWAQDKTRRYCIPGKVEAKKATTKMPGDRVILKDVPLCALTAVHYAGVNVYDAKYHTTDDVLKDAIPQADFNPMLEDPSAKMGAAKDFRIAAGPLPPDASGSSCQYEWSIQVRCESELQMYQLAATLRRCQRLDHYQQASKVLEYQSKKHAEAPVMRHVQKEVKVGGQLEVLLVQARRLKPTKSGTASLAEKVGLWGKTTKATIRSDQALDETYLPNLSGTVPKGRVSKATPEGSRIDCFVNFRMVNAGQVIPYRGNNVQSSIIVSGTDSPCWAEMPELSTSGGWVFRTGIIDPAKLPELLIDFEVMQTTMTSNMKLGGIQLPVTQRNFLINPAEPFKNLWLPLVNIVDGKPVTSPTGEIHIMTRWLPAEKIQTLSDGSSKVALSVRSHFEKDLWARVCAQRIREPIYNLEVRYLNYNPNLVRRGAAVVDEKGVEAPAPQPEALKDFVQRHTEEMANMVPYLECLDRRQTEAWQEFEQIVEEDDTGLRLGERVLLWQDPGFEDLLAQFQELIQRGIPSQKRERLWLEVTMASRVMEKDGISTSSVRTAMGEQAVKEAEKEYKTLLERGLPQTSDAMKQLQEDAYNLSNWESTHPPLPALFDQHLQRIKRAQNVCTALLAVTGEGVTYCEGLLVVAFFLLLPQGCREERVAGDNSLVHPTESSVFWLLYTLICPRINGSYREYFGVPARPDDEAAAQLGLQAAPSLLSGSGVMDDVHLLECCISYHLPKLWTKMVASGFQLSTVFYGAFTRLFATFMPTATVFRFWDILFAQSTDPQALPNGRAYLVDLAYGIVSSKKEDIMQAQSAYEIRCIILGMLSALYDTTTVVDITVLAHQFLWGGTGFSRSKVSELFMARVDMFRSANKSISDQNEVLKILTHELKLKLGGTRALSAGVTLAKGCRTSDVLYQIIPIIEQGLTSPSSDALGLRQAQQESEALATLIQRAQKDLNEEKDPKAAVEKKKALDDLTNKQQAMKSRLDKLPKYWGQFRPMPLCSKMLGATVKDNLKGWVGKQLKQKEVLQKPYRIEPPFPSGDARRGSKMEPTEIVVTRIMETLKREIPSWEAHANAIWNCFNNSMANQADARNTEYDGFQTLNANGGYANSNEQSGNAPSAFMSATSCVNPKHYVDDAEEEVIMSNEARTVDINQFGLKEFFTALICASRGTLGEKAAALFSLYAYRNPVASTDACHLTPLTPLAKSVADDSAQVVGAASSTQLAPCPPDSDDAKKAVLRFTIKTNYEVKNAIMGHVLVSTLTPFIGSASGVEPPPVTFNIWGPERTMAVKNSKAKQPKTNLVVSSNAPAGMVCCGELAMCLIWTPGSVRKPEEGQLTLIVKYIKFFQAVVSDHFKVNPWIEVEYLHQPPRPAQPLAAGQQPSTIAKPEWKPIKRWDPRSLRGFVTTHGAYGGTIKFEATMAQSALGDKQKNYMRDGNQGFDQTKKQWQWNDVWGKQQSDPKFTVPKEFVDPTSENAMDIRGVRMIVTSVLQRCMLNVTNREAIVVSDALFNRQGAVPGILEAILVKGNLTKERPSWDKLKTDNPDAQDVTRELMIEHERQIQMNAGDLSLFEKSFMAKYTPTLQSHLKIDHFSGTQRVLWIRYVRAGNGARGIHAIKIKPSGEIEKHLPNQGLDPNYTPEVKFEADPTAMVSKAEFVSCVLASPLLGESLRRLGAFTHEFQAKRCIPMEIEIVSATGGDQEVDVLEDILDVQQSVLLEVWDTDGAKDFIGEGWLPPISEFSSEPKDVVIPLFAADYDGDAERGSSRVETLKIEKGDGVKELLGELFATVSWVFPIYKEDPEELLSIVDWLESLKVDPNRARDGTPHGQVLTAMFDDISGIRNGMVESDGKVKETLFTEYMQVNEAEKRAIKEYFKNNRKKDSQSDRAKIEREKHSGRLQVTLRSVRNLRRPDKKKEPSPNVHMWIRNDISQKFRKEVSFKSSAAKSVEEKGQDGKKYMVDRSIMAEWKKGNVHDLDLMVGRFEVRFEEEKSGIMASIGSNLRTSKQQEALDAESNAQALKRFEGEGLKIRFEDASRKKGQQLPDGQNHKVEIYPSDSIREFKSKISLACEQERAYWTQSQGAGSHQATKFKDVTIGHKHVVMVFEAPLKIMKIIEQKKQGTAEFQKAYEQALNDPSCWQPLDPAKTISQYMSRYGFGANESMPLRVIEPTETYKSQNLRYKKFAAGEAIPRYEDVNTSKRCFAWAKFVHEDDDKTTEWRPAFLLAAAARKEQEVQEAGKKEDAKKDVKKDDKKDDKKEAGQDKKEQEAKDDTVFAEWVFPDQDAKTAKLTDHNMYVVAPRCPRFQQNLHEDHERLLKSALMYRKAGKNDWEIQLILKDLMDDEWRKKGKQDKQDDEKKPPEITKDIISAYFLQKDEEETQAKLQKESDN